MTGYAFALASFWKERAERLERERDDALKKLSYFLASHSHQWIDVTTLGDLSKDEQRHVCGCGASKVTTTKVSVEK